MKTVVFQRTKRRLILVTEAERLIDELSYEDIQRYSRYFLSVAPKTPDEFLRRWLFSFSSIQTGWAQNVALYNAIKDLQWGWSEDALLGCIKGSKAGLHNRRCRFIWGFYEQFRKNPAKFYGRKGESWVDYRDRLMGMIPGIGLAKTAFVLEMTWPIKAQICCLDRHIIRMFGENAEKITNKKYKELEQEWVRLCKRKGAPPAIARAICWDKIQDESDSSYWCCVFHEERTILSRALAV